MVCQNVTKSFLTAFPYFFYSLEQKQDNTGSVLKNIYATIPIEKR
jgi:hypothetical protein